MTSQDTEDFTIWEVRKFGEILRDTYGGLWWRSQNCKEWNSALWNNEMKVANIKLCSDWLGMVLDGTPRKRECQGSGARSQLAQPFQVLRCLLPTPRAHTEMWLLHCDVSVDHIAPTSNTSYGKWFSLSTCLCLKASWSINHFGIEWLSVLCVCSSSISFFWSWHSRLSTINPSIASFSYFFPQNPQTPASLVYLHHYEFLIWPHFIPSLITLLHFIVWVSSTI